MKSIILSLAVSIGLVVLGYLGVRELNLFKIGKKIFDEMPKAYKILGESLKGMKWVYWTGVAVELIAVLVIILQKQFASDAVLNAVIVGGIWIATFLIFYLSIGIPIAIFHKVNGCIVSMAKVYTQLYTLCISLLMLIGAYTGFVEQGTRWTYYISLLGTGIVYMMNMKILYLLLNNPSSIIQLKSDTVINQNQARKTLLNATIILVCMIIVDFSFAVWIISRIDTFAFCNRIHNFWDSLYYVIISFTTVGYGDVAPVHFLSQFITVLMAVTSVVYLVVFLNCIVSYIQKDEVQKSN